MPHTRTWGRILAHAVDPTALATVLGQFFDAAQRVGEVPHRGRIVVAVDGKTLRGTIPLGQTHGVHLVAAYLPETEVTLAQLSPGCDRAGRCVVAPPQARAVGAGNPE